MKRHVPMIDSSTVVLVLDEGNATSLDALGAAVALFGRGNLKLVYVHDRASLPGVAALGAGVAVVDVDRDPDPKNVLAEVVEAGLPVVVLTDGLNSAIPDHALSVGAAACLATSLPARELVSRLSSAVSTERPRESH